MTVIDARQYDFRQLNEKIRDTEGDVRIENCLGERYIGLGLSGRKLEIDGVPGNALGAYLDSAEITVNGNAQDAVGDTMNSGRIIINGSAGDAAGYAMRGGEIFIRDDAGYRAGIHIKAYAEKNPVIVVGGKCGSFLGEYQAGGMIIVLGIGCSDEDIVGAFCGTGMHGGKIYLRCGEMKKKLPSQVMLRACAGVPDGIADYINRYEKYFGRKLPRDGKSFFELTPNSGNPYKQLYVRN